MRAQARGFLGAPLVNGAISTIQEVSRRRTLHLTQLSSSLETVILLFLLSVLSYIDHYHQSHFTSLCRLCARINPIFGVYAASPTGCGGARPTHICMHSRSRPRFSRNVACIHARTRQIRGSQYSRIATQEPDRKKQDSDRHPQTRI